MYRKVKLLRRCGQKRDAREYLAAEPLILPLRNARLITMHGNKMLFVGIERDGAVGFKHEWAVQVIDAK